MDARVFINECKVEYLEVLNSFFDWENFKNLLLFIIELEFELWLFEIQKYTNCYNELPMLRKHKGGSSLKNFYSSKIEAKVSKTFYSFLRLVLLINHTYCVKII